MYGARSNDHQQSLFLIGSLDDRGDLLAAFNNSPLGLFGLGDFMLEQIGRSQRVVAAN